MKQYYLMEPDQIADDVLANHKVEVENIEGVECFVLPKVYPSNKFRSSKFLLTQIKLHVKGKRICDMGCGCGIVGLTALFNGALSVAQVDINPMAIKNADLNRVFHSFNQKQLQIIQSNCFDEVPLQKFDTVIFNIPFHSDPWDFNNMIEYAFHDPEFMTLKKFLKQVVSYSHKDTKIIIAFSSRGAVHTIENLFDAYGFQWILWKVANQNQKYDSRLYLLKPSFNTNDSMHSRKDRA